MSDLSRRSFLVHAQAAGLFFAAFSPLAMARGHSANAGLPLETDPEGLLDLPQGFTYRLLSSTGGPMQDGFFLPGRPDGMACFADPADPARLILMRNHENWPDTEDGSPYGEDEALADRFAAGQLYDRKADGRPFTGGVTRAVYDRRSGQFVSENLVLAGTTGNCAGGATPWGSWLSCEESAITEADGAQRPHGFVFECPSSATGVIDPVPLAAMGRFSHEAAAIDPAAGIVYLTEDARDGLFYRFLPDTPGELARGGRLQALAIREMPATHTNNWPRDWRGNGIGGIEQGATFAADWIDLDHVEAPDGDLAARGHAAGAAYFCRGEGMAFGQRPGEDSGSIFFNCTQGGSQRSGQVWRYTPGEGAGSGALTLVYESPGGDTLDLCDNLAFAPWGDLILCEDGMGDNYLRGLTPDGRVYDLARNAHSGQSEFCGACFSPDGRILFVNIQVPGFTLAIEGPWETLRSA